MSSKCPSSLDPQIGSAQSIPSQVPRRSPRVNGFHPNEPQYQNENPHDRETQSDNYSQGQSAATYRPLPRSGPYSTGQDRVPEHSNSNTHHLPAYIPQNPRYASQISLGEEQDVASPSTSQPRTQNSPYQNNYSMVTQARSYPTQPAASQSSTATNPVTNWSLEHSTEERLRVGLPRYDSEEAERQAYIAAIKRGL